MIPRWMLLTYIATDGRVLGQRMARTVFEKPFEVPQMGRRSLMADMEKRLTMGDLTVVVELLGKPVGSPQTVPNNIWSLCETLRQGFDGGDRVVHITAFVP